MDRNELVESLMVLKYCISSDDIWRCYWKEDGTVEDNVIDTYSMHLERVTDYYDNKYIKSSGRNKMMDFVDNTLLDLGWTWYDDWQDDALRGFYKWQNSIQT